MTTEIIQPFKPNEVLGASKMNALRRAATKRISGIPPVEITETLDQIIIHCGKEPNVFWIGVINSTGLSDYSDCRYYVIPQDITNSDVDSTVAPTWENTPLPSDYARTVFNLAELTTPLSDSTHNLSEGERIVVVERWDDSAPPQKYYLTCVQPSDLILRLTDLSDVADDYPDEGDCLWFHLGKWISHPPSTLNLKLSDLSDVVASLPNEGDCLVFNTGKWRSMSPSSAFSEILKLNDLSDVAVTSPGASDCLVFRSGMWQKYATMEVKIMLSDGSTRPALIMDPS